MKVLVLFILIFSFGCSKNQSKTELTVSISSITGSLLFPGGLIVSGKSTTGAKFVMQVPANDIVVLQIPNGVWNIATVGWDGAAMFEGDSYCGFQASVKLDGGEKDLNFSTSIANCSNAVFGGHADIAEGFHETQFNSCLGIKKYIQEEGPMASDPGGSCNGGGGPLDGGSESYKIRIPEVMAMPDGSTQILSTSIISACQTGGTDGKQDTSLRLPFGTSTFSLPYIVEAFADPACAGAVTSYDYIGGLTIPAQANRGGVTPDDTAEKIGFYLHIDQCVGDQLTNLPFAAGTDATGYLICTGDQLTKIYDSSCIASGTSGMNCTGTHSYQIGKNINLSGITAAGLDAYVSAAGIALEGEIDGKGYTISNGVLPLINNIVPGADGSVRNLNLDSFVIPPHAGTSDNVGVLVNIISNTDASDFRYEIENIKITNSSITENAAGHSASIGGLIGNILTTYSVEVRENTVFVDITTTGASAGQTVGGLIGKSSGAKQLRAENNRVGVTHEDPTNFSSRVTISAKEKIGGLIGNLEHGSVDSGNIAVTTITGTNAIGGLIGYSNPTYNASPSLAEAVYVRDSISNIIFAPTATTTSVGGIIGEVDDAGPNHIDGVLSTLAIPNTSNVIDNIGGIVGFNTSGGITRIEIRNSSAFYDIQANGEAYGGFIGKITPTSFSGDDTINGSIAKGIIKVNSIMSINKQRAGAIGHAYDVRITKSIIDADIDGDSMIGGVYGILYNDAQAEELEVNTILRASNLTDTDLYTGGIIGKSVAAAAVDQFKAIRLNVDIILDIASANCNAAGTCGMLVGSNINTADNVIASFGGILWEGTMLESTTTPIGSPEKCGNVGAGTVANCDAGNFVHIYTDFSSVPDCSSLDTNSYPYYYADSICHMAFERRWKEFGYDVANSRYLAGNMLQPFPLSTADQVNAIEDDVLLVTKTYELKNNIDMSTSIYGGPGNTLPIGDGNPFSGSIIPNGFALNNVDIVGRGLFVNVDNGANIGLRDDPLKINNFDLQCDADACGVIGEAKSSNISVIVTEGDITVSASENQVGGIVGSINDASADVRITNSGYSGSIVGNSDVGGLVGRLNLAGGQVSIQESYAKLDHIQGTTGVGGLLGSSITGGVVNIENCYVLIDPNNNHAGDDFDSTAPSGGILGYIVGITPVLNNVFIDVSNATLNANFRTIADGSTSSIAADTYIIDGGIPLTDSYVGVTNHYDPDTHGELTEAPVNFDVSHDSEFTLSNGKVVLGWEVFGYHKN